MRWAWRDHRKQSERLDAVTWCPDHGKNLFSNRKDAKRAIRIQHLGGTTPMREYRCHAREGWHIGHLPQAVKWGVRTRSEHYGESS